MPARASCKCCNQQCDNHQLVTCVTCSVCKDKYKHTCVDITANEIRILNANKGYDWTCVDCRATGKDLNELKALIMKLQEDIKQLKTHNDRNLGTSPVDFEEVVTEINERQKRKSNIIIFNLEEQDQSKPPAERAELDKTAVNNILRFVVPNFNLRNMKPVRLGLFSTTKKRPVKLVLENSDQVRNMVINGKKLKDSNTYRNIIIAPDRTKRQLDYFKSVKQELLQRMNAGETNIRIKFSFLKLCLQTKFARQQYPGCTYCVLSKCEGLNTKFDIVYPAISVSDFDLIAFSETWLKQSTLSAEVFPDGYEVFRKDRKFDILEVTTGGGVLLAVKENFKCSVVDTPIFDNQFPSIDFLCCKCHVSHMIIYFIVLYIPPSVASYDFDLFFETLEQWDFLLVKKLYF
nr:unnamed protein product [Callosobruchus chinensis]